VLSKKQNLHYLSEFTQRERERTKVKSCGVGWMKAYLQLTHTGPFGNYNRIIVKKIIKIRDFT